MCPNAAIPALFHLEPFQFNQFSSTVNKLNQIIRVVMSDYNTHFRCFKRICMQVLMTTDSHNEI